MLVLSASQIIPLVLLFNGLLAPLFAVLIYNLARGGGGILHWALSRPVLVLLGEASYALYILQEPLWKWSLSVAATLTGQHTIWTESGFVAIYIGVLVLVSLLSFRLVEQPAGRPLAARLERSRTGRQAWRAHGWGDGPQHRELSVSSKSTRLHSGSAWFCSSSGWV